jgi:hypothetical protein
VEIGSTTLGQREKTRCFIGFMASPGLSRFCQNRFVKNLSKSAPSVGRLVCGIFVESFRRGSFWEVDEDERLDSNAWACENCISRQIQESQMSSREEIVQQALALSLEDRAYVADVIEHSLGGGEFATPEVAAAWMTEIERRAQAYERGETTAEDWRSVISRLRARHPADSKR